VISLGAEVIVLIREEKRTTESHVVHAMCDVRFIGIEHIHRSGNCFGIQQLDIAVTTATVVPVKLPASPWGTLQREHQQFHVRRTRMVVV
jgi:hypothetical protein